jgi:alpha-N-acetylglucosaminidase
MSGNVNGHAGPLTQNWMNKQFELAQLILKRERQFGMKPILPGFNGFVPPQLKKIYPSSKVDQLQSWAGFNGTFYLNPLDPMFQTIGKKISQKVVEQFGTDHLYNIDPFNEEDPPTNDTSYLSAVGKALFKPLVDSDPDAIWVLQGWFLHFHQSFWKPEQVS